MEYSHFLDSTKKLFFYLFTTKCHCLGFAEHETQKLSHVQVIRYKTDINFFCGNFYKSCLGGRWGKKLFRKVCILNGYLCIHWVSVQPLILKLIPVICPTVVVEFFDRMLAGWEFSLCHFQNTDHLVSQLFLVSKRDIKLHSQLHHWTVKVKDKLTSKINDFTQKIILSSPWSKYPTDVLH